VILDYELKRDLNRDLVARGQRKDDPEAKESVALRHGLRVVDGKIPVPDVRVEYEESQHELTRVDLELATRHYPRALSTFLAAWQSKALVPPRVPGHRPLRTRHSSKTPMSEAFCAPFKGPQEV